MPSFGFKLYFAPSVHRDEMRRRILALPECKPKPDQPDSYWSSYVNFHLGNLDQEQKQKEILHTTGLEVGDFYVSLKVYTGDEEAFKEKWDRALDLLAHGEDAVAIQEFESILLIQKKNQLTLDSPSQDLAPYYRDYILSKRTAELAPLGNLKEPD